MVEVESFLMASIERLLQDSMQREARLTNQLNALSEQLRTMDANYRGLQQQVVRLAGQVDDLATELERWPKGGNGSSSGGR